MHIGRPAGRPYPLGLRWFQGGVGLGCMLCPKSFLIARLPGPEGRHGGYESGGQNAIRAPRRHETPEMPEVRLYEGELGEPASSPLVSASRSLLGLARPHRALARADGAGPICLSGLCILLSGGSDERVSSDLSRSRSASGPQLCLRGEWASLASGGRRILCVLRWSRMSRGGFYPCQRGTC